MPNHVKALSDNKIYKKQTTLYFLVEAAGGKALPCVVDVRDEGQVRRAIQMAVEKVRYFFL